MLAISKLDEISSPPLAPVEHPIDQDHLARMTLGDRSLEREVLTLFNRQAALLLSRIHGASAEAAAAAAHTLKGSALGIGAWQVAQAAEALERAVGSGHEAHLQALRLVVGEASAAIAGLLRSH